MSERKHSVKKVTALHWAHTAGHRQSTQKAPPAPRNCLSCKQSDQSFAASTAVTSVSSSGTTCLRSVLCPLPTLGCPSVTPAPKFHLPRAGPQPWPEDAFCIPQPADHTRGTGVSNTGFKMECATCKGEEGGGTSCLALKMACVAMEERKGERMSRRSLSLLTTEITGKRTILF